MITVHKKKKFGWADFAKANTTRGAANSRGLLQEKSEEGVEKKTPKMGG